ncbi:MAG: hypothetical protein ACOH12_15815 [Parvibaculaceae bacterium]
MKAVSHRSVMPTLAHIALSVFAIVGLLMFNATSQAEGINQSDADYAMLQRTIQTAAR